MNEALNAAADVIRPYMGKIAMAITAALLALFGDHINSAVRTAVKNQNFMIRLAVFIFLVAFGYGALGLGIAHVLSKLLAKIPGTYLCLALAVIFIIIGVIAEEKKQI